MTLPLRVLASALITAVATHARAASPLAPLVLHVDVASPNVVVSFELSGNDAVGFQHRQHTPAEKAAVGRVMAKLTNSGQWIRFNAEAQCNSSVSNVAANIYRIIDPEAPPPKPPIIKPAFDANVTFSCNAIAALRSADIMLIAQLPRLRTVIVDVHSPSGNHTDTVTTPTATISLAPN